MKKWNFETRKYEKYSVPERWRVGLYSRDSEELVDCAKCGKPIKISSKYRSLEVYNEMGQEYAVCKGCFKDEWVKRQVSIMQTNSIQIEEVYMEIDDGER